MCETKESWESFVVKKIHDHLSLTGKFNSSKISIHVHKLVTSGSTEDLSLLGRTARSFERHNHSIYQNYAYFAQVTHYVKVLKQKIHYNDRSPIRKFATAVESTKSLHKFSIKCKDDVGEMSSLRINGTDGLGNCYHKKCRNNFVYIPYTRLLSIERKMLKKM